MKRSDYELGGVDPEGVMVIELGKGGIYDDYRLYSRKLEHNQSYII